MICRSSLVKLFVPAFVALVFATLCYFIEPLTNKITEGTEIIRYYESAFFLTMAAYFLLQLLPGFAVLKIDEQGYEEIWFFRRRIRVNWKDVDFSQLINGPGDSLYLNQKNEQLFSRKVAVKGTYSWGYAEIYSHFAEHAGSYHSKPNTDARYYFSLRPIRKKLWWLWGIVFVLVNLFYLNVGQTYPKFSEQLANWQQRGETPEQLFERFKPLGVSWKPALKQLDRALYLEVLSVEAKQIEAHLLTRYQHQNQPSQPVLIRFKKDMKKCRDDYLGRDESRYLNCLNHL